MKMFLTALATAAFLAIVGKKEKEIKALAEALDEADAVRAAMAAELRYQAGSQLLLMGEPPPVQRIEKGH